MKFNDDIVFWSFRPHSFLTFDKKMKRRINQGALENRVLRKKDNITKVINK